LRLEKIQEEEEEEEEEEWKRGEIWETRFAVLCVMRREERVPATSIHNAD